MSEYWIIVAAVAALWTVFAIVGWAICRLASQVDREVAELNRRKSLISEWCEDRNGGRYTVYQGEEVR
jgi:hypothetical protein